MATSIDPDLAARLRAESKASKDNPYPDGASLAAGQLRAAAPVDERILDRDAGIDFSGKQW